MGSPIPRLPYGQIGLSGGQAAASPILDWMKQMYLQRMMGGGPPPSGPSPVPSTMAPPAGPNLMTTPAAPPALLPSHGPSFEPVNQKTAPSAPLKFAWGGGTPEAYVPGQTDILQLKGAPSARPGFMGAEPNFGGQTMRDESGSIRNAAASYTPGRTALEQYANTANPMAFNSFSQLPEQTEIMKAAADPAWREKEIVQATAAAEGQQARLTAAEQVRLLGQQRQEQMQEALTAALEAAAAEKGITVDKLSPAEVSMIRATIMQNMVGMSGMQLR